MLTAGALIAGTASRGSGADKQRENSVAARKKTPGRKRGPREEEKRSRDQVLRDNAWKPGQSGNPAGRPPNPLSLTSEIKAVGDLPAPKKILDEIRDFIPDIPEETTWVRALAYRNWIRAMDQKGGDIMAKEIAERLDGKVPFPVSGEGGGPIPIRFDFEKLSSRQLDELEKILERCQMES